ncbi:hypothetical protein UMM65_00260 [Aureibaculum sp. 2210JD6-5]|uniref:hypothetical protein n=1 Tax=Aureibaculum sp. 2210JD6-5 TaxID=3103957 RepID=UPI002AAE5551|nr:hypothetical protein [Aureibaculum sp. 2210JD6-5]MDY7393661.1 hypothetical protein [Aureibaculum sp. 2210JD6-5]
MDNEQNKNIEKLVDKLMKDDGLASSSSDFTNTVMAKVEQLNQQKTFAYKPIISKKMWFAIATLIVGFSIYLAFFGNLTKSKWFANIELDFSMNFLSSLNFSNTTLYATIIVSLLFLIQIVMLKNYFDKRLNT